MADVTHSLPHQNSILHTLGAPFRAILRGMIAISEADPRLKQIDKLNGMSDEALAKHGLARKDIVHYVFRHHLLY